MTFPKTQAQTSPGSLGILEILKILVLLQNVGKNFQFSRIEVSAIFAMES